MCTKCIQSVCEVCTKCLRDVYEVSARCVRGVYEVCTDTEVHEVSEIGEEGERVREGVQRVDGAQPRLGHRARVQQPLRYVRQLQIQITYTLIKLS